MECCYIEVQKGKERHGFLFSFCLRGHCGYIYIIHHDNFFCWSWRVGRKKLFYFIHSLKVKKSLEKDFLKLVDPSLPTWKRKRKRLLQLPITDYDAMSECLKKNSCLSIVNLE